MPARFASRLLLAGTAAALLGMLILTPTGVSATDANLHAEMDGQFIAIKRIPTLHCHDAAYPEVRCFVSELQRDKDFASSMAPTASLGAQVAPTSETLATLAVTYVIWYDNANYGGGSFQTANSWSNMVDISWNDRISSFKAYNNGRPKWFQDSDYGGWWTMWGTNVWLSYVGDAFNDQFTSVYDYNG